MSKNATLTCAAFLTLICTIPAMASDNTDELTGHHLYINSNDKINKIIHYAQLRDGRLLEVSRIPTGGKGTGGYKPLTGQAFASDSLVSAGALTVSPDHKWLFVVNAGDDTVSSFEIDKMGNLHLVDTQSTESAGDPSTLSFNAEKSMLYVGHTFGPDHIKIFSVKDGKLALKPGFRSVNHGKAKDRILTQVQISPDQKYLLANVLYDKRPENLNGKVNLEPANTTTKDGLVVFPVDGNGGLGEPKFFDAGGSTPFGLTFISGSDGKFVNTFDEAPGVAVLSRLNQDGSVTNLSRAQVKLSVPGVDNIGACWVSMSPDGKTAFVAASDSGEVASFRINGDNLSFAKGGLGLLEKQDTSNDPSAKANGTPVGNWVSPNGYLYQLYPAAAKLIAYRINDDALERVGSYAVPLNSAEGIGGF